MPADIALEKGLPHNLEAERCVLGAIILDNALVNQGKIPPAHAETILQLLHSFGPTELASPETYDVLIEYLNHDVLGIRGLAHWHLERLVPSGKKIKYNPLGTPDERSKAQVEWRKLLPSGELPPKATRQQNIP